MTVSVHDVVTKCPGAYWEIMRDAVVKAGRVEIKDQKLLERCDEPFEVRLDSPGPKMAFLPPSHPKKTPLGPIAAQMPAKWPLWAKVIGVRIWGGKAELGLGDTLEGIFRRWGIAWGANWLGKITGQGCKCKTRRDQMNIFYPYKLV